MYQRLETALSSLIGGQKPIKGTLGYTIDGAYRVTVAEDAAKYYVRFADGSFAQVYHRGRVSPVPDLPVEVGFDSAGNMVIVGGDPDRAGLFDGAHEVGPHSHARGSGLEFPIDTRLLTPVKAAPLSGLTVEVAQGAYRHGGALHWWGGGAITLTPPGSANTWAWVAIGLDPATETLVTASGSAIVVSAPLEPSTIPAISLAGAIPLAAVRVRNGQTELDDADFEDLRYALVDVPAVLGDLNDADTSGASDGEVLTYASGTWTPQTLPTPSGDLPAFGAGVGKTLSSDVAAAGSDRHLVLSAETGTADDLIEITGLSAGDEAIVRAASGHTVTVKHDDAGATDKIMLYNGADIALSGDATLKLVKIASGKVVQYIDEKGTGGGGGTVTLLAPILIDRQTPTGNSVTFTIPTGYDRYAITLIGGGTDGAAYVAINMTINSDTTDRHYYRQHHDTEGSTQYAGTGQTRSIGYLVSDGTPGDTFSRCALEFHDVASVSRYKAFYVYSDYTYSTNYFGFARRKTVWQSTAAVTSITLTLSAGNFVAGSIASLIGWKSQAVAT